MSMHPDRVERHFDTTNAWRPLKDPLPGYRRSAFAA